WNVGIQPPRVKLEIGETIIDRFPRHASIDGVEDSPSGDSTITAHLDRVVLLRVDYWLQDGVVELCYWCPAETPVVALEDGSCSATKLCVCTRVDNERIHGINSEGGDDLSEQPGRSPSRAEIIAADDSVSAGAREDRVRALRIDRYANKCSART